MKILMKFTFFLVIALFFVGCSTNPTKVLPKKDGKWNWTGTSVYKVTGLPDQTESSSGTMVFTDDKVTITESGSSGSEVYDWSYNKDSKKMTITQGSDALIFDVTETKRKNETWVYSESQTVAGVTSSLTITYNLSR